MSDIFISYASEDRERARNLAAALEAQGWSVWWDRTIPTGKKFDEIIDEAVKDARSILVLWSRVSIVKDWVLEEAEDARERHILIPVFIENVKPPRGFRRYQAADLSDWDGATTAPPFQMLVTDIAAILGHPTVQGKEHLNAEEKHKEAEKKRLEQERIQKDLEPQREIEDERKSKEEGQRRQHTEAKHKVKEQASHFDKEQKRREERTTKVHENASKPMVWIAIGVVLLLMTGGGWYLWEQRELKPPLIVTAPPQSQVEAARIAKLEAGRKAEEEARRKAELETKQKEQAKAEAARIAKLEAGRKAEEEARRKAELETKQKEQAKAEAARIAKLEAGRKAEEEARRKAELETKQKEQAKAEAARIAKLEAERKAEEEARRKADLEAKDTAAQASKLPILLSAESVGAELGKWLNRDQLRKLISGNTLYPTHGAFSGAHIFFDKDGRAYYQMKSEGGKVIEGQSTWNIINSRLCVDLSALGRNAHPYEKVVCYLFKQDTDFKEFTLSIRSINTPFRQQMITMIGKNISGKVLKGRDNI